MRLLACLLLSVAALQAEPFEPASAGIVLERVPSGARIASRNLQRDLPTALVAAREYIQLARSTSEPRYLGYAQGALAPWIQQTNPPSEVRYLRAIIRQSNHQFDAALADLELLPNDRPALLSKILVLSAQGKILEARKECLKHPSLASDLTGLAALANVTSLNGQLESSYALLRRSISDSSTNAWAWTTLAEMAVRAGKNAEAELAYQKALALTPDDPYLAATYADFNPAAARPYLLNKTNSDACLLRLALSDQNPRDLAERFAATGNLHAREAATFYLHLLHKPEEALRLARINWQTQREPADAKILLETALAARDPAAAKPVLDWLIQTRLEDVRLAPLRNQL